MRRLLRVTSNWPDFIVPARGPILLFPHFLKNGRINFGSGYIRIRFGAKSHAGFQILQGFLVSSALVPPFALISVSSLLYHFHYIPRSFISCFIFARNAGYTCLMSSNEDKRIKQKMICQTVCPLSHHCRPRHKLYWIKRKYLFI